MPESHIGQYLPEKWSISLKRIFLRTPTGTCDEYNFFYSTPKLSVSLASWADEDSVSAATSPSL